MFNQKPINGGSGMEQQPPVIIGGGDLGSKIAPFAMTYRVYDPANEAVTVLEKLNGVVINTRPAVPQNTDLTFSITQALWDALTINANHSITIEATNESGLTSTNQATFYRQNNLPTAPIVLSPVAGASIVGATTIEWTASIDPDVGQSVTYKVYFSTNGGVTKTQIAETEGTSVTWDVSGLTPGSAYQIFVCGYDGLEDGAFGASGVFRVLATPPQFIEVRDIEGNTVALLSPKSDGLKNCWIDDEQNGSCTLEFELPLNNPKWQYLTDRYRIYAGGKEFVILNPDAVDKQRDGKKLKGKVKAHESWVLLGKKYQTISNDPLIGTPPWGAVIIVSGGTAHGGFDPGSAGSALSYLLQGTGWSVGTVDVTGTYDLETEKESVLYNINQVQEKWGGILIWDSVNKTVSLRDEATYKPYTGFQIRYAKNLKGITRTDDYDIVTRLYPFGENDLNIANVNGGLLYLDNHSYSDDILEGVWYNQDIADQTQLKIAGEKQLAVMCRPRHNYKTEVLDLRALPGYGHETFNRSDMVDLIDEDLGTDAQVRIIRYRYNVFQPWLCDMELGDPLEKISATVAQTVLMAKFYKNVVAPNTSFQNLLKAIINTEATEINGASGDYTLKDGVSTWFDRDPETGELTGKLLRITPQGLIISHDGGQTWKLAISGEGIHADAGWVGKLNAGVITVGPETTFAPGYDPVDNHVYFQYSADGTTNWHDTFNPASDKYMRQKVGDNGTWSDPMRVVGEDGKDGKDGYTPIKGVDYFDGVDGQDGVSSYLWVRYSQNADGNPMTTDPTGAVYIGVATTTTPTAPTSHTAYQWSLIKGQDGVPGEKGADGQTSYLHIKYSDDGVTFTANNGETPGAYIGTYVDFNPVDSMNFNDYTWNKVRGEDGYTPIKGVDYFDGVDGQDGTSAYLWVRYSQNSNGDPMTTDPTGAVYIGVATTTTPTAPTSHTAYQWSLIKGQDGVPGEKGADGQTSYLHIKYSDDGVTFTANNGETPGAYIGTYVDFNPVDSTDFNAYTWNKVKGEDGQDVRKFTSQPVPPYDVGDLWIGGSDGQNTLICTTARSSGSFVASDWQRMTEPVANMGVDSDCTGLWHFDGTLNSHKGVSATFTRASVAYLSDGTKVEAGQPRFEQGKFGQAVMVEEGTTNYVISPKTQINIVSPSSGFTAYNYNHNHPYGGVPQSQAVTYAVSFELKQRGTYPFDSVVLGGGAGGDAWNIRIKRDLTLQGTGVSGSVTTKPLADGWKRYECVFTIPTTGYLQTFVNFITAYETGAVDSDIRNVQLEQKPFATSFIDGTRSPETLTIPTAGVWNKGSWTVEAIYKPNNGPCPSHWNLVWECYIDALNWYQVGAEQTTGYLKARVSSAGTIYTISSNIPIVAGTIYSLAASGDGSTLKFYVNGSLIGSTVYTEPVGTPSYMYIGANASSQHHANTLIDELRIDKIARTDEEIAGWYKANAPFYTSEDMKQLPGYLRAESDGYKVYDAEGALRALLGSWLKDAVRKYGLKIIDGEIYSSIIRSGAEDADTYIQFKPPNSLEVYYGGYLQMLIEAVNGGRITFYNNGTMIGRLSGAYSGADLGIIGIGTGKVAIGGNLNVAGTISAYSKSNIEYTDNYGGVYLVVRESPEHRYIDEGMGVLNEGTCKVDIDPVFLECIEPHTRKNKWYIQLTAYGDVDIYVAEIGLDYFIVKEKNNGINTGAEFTWSLSATRKNYANIRFLGVID